MKAKARAAATRRTRRRPPSLQDAAVVRTAPDTPPDKGKAAPRQSSAIRPRPAAPPEEASPGPPRPSRRSRSRSAEAGCPGCLHRPSPCCLCELRLELPPQNSDSRAAACTPRFRRIRARLERYILHGHQEHDRLCPGRRSGRRARAGTGRCAPSTAAASTSGCACRPASRAWSRASARPSAKRIARGSVTVNLNVKRAHGQTQIRLNENGAEAGPGGGRTPQDAMSRWRRRAAEALLSIKGVLELVEPEESEAEAAGAHRSDAGEPGPGPRRHGACARRRGPPPARPSCWSSSRRSSAWSAPSSAAPARAPDAVRQRLKEQVGRLLEAGAALDETRLYQEAALLATRADTEEELKRLAAHVRRPRAAAAIAGACGPAPRLPRPGVQSRGQHTVLQVAATRDDAGRP